MSARASAPTGFDVGLQEKAIFWWAFIGAGPWLSSLRLSPLSLDFTYTSLAAGFHRRRVTRTCFCGRRKSSMFAEMPLDNRTVDKFAAVAAITGFLRPLETSPRMKRLIVSS
jgi:hypothetical protein